MHFSRRAQKSDVSHILCGYYRRTFSDLMALTKRHLFVSICATRLATNVCYIHGVKVFYFLICTIDIEEPRDPSFTYDCTRCIDAKKRFEIDLLLYNSQNRYKVFVLVRKFEFQYIEKQQKTFQYTNYAN